MLRGSSKSARTNIATLTPMMAWANQAGSASNLKTSRRRQLAAGAFKPQYGQTLSLRLISNPQLGQRSERRCMPTRVFMKIGVASRPPLGKEADYHKEYRIFVQSSKINTGSDRVKSFWVEYCLKVCLTESYFFAFFEKGEYSERRFIQ
jgi:hypothetical protein